MLKDCTQILHIKIDYKFGIFLGQSSIILYSYSTEFAAISLQNIYIYICIYIAVTCDIVATFVQLSNKHKITCNLNVLTCNLKTYL